MTSKVKMLVLSLTGKCNFNCRYCYASEHERICMSREIALAALKLAPRDECFVLQFSGGEPLLNFKTLQAVVEQVERDNLPAVMSFVDIDNRVEYDCVGSADYIKCECREVINESLEHDTHC